MEQNRKEPATPPVDFTRVGNFLTTGPGSKSRRQRPEALEEASHKGSPGRKSRETERRGLLGTLLRLA